MKWFALAAANQGNAQAQVNLGVRYLRGQGVAQDDAAALKWFRFSAAQEFGDVNRSGFAGGHFV